jgi:hypothetical protein
MPTTKFSKDQALLMANRTASFCFRNDDNDALKPIIDLIETVFIPQEIEYYSQLQLAESIMMCLHNAGRIEEEV